MKYKVKDTDILYNGKLYPEGSIIMPDEKSIKQLTDYLDPIPEEKPTKTTKPATTAPKDTTNKTTVESPKQSGEVSNG